MEQNIVKTGLTRSKNCKKAIVTYSNYRVFWRSGFAYRGAGEREIKREGQREILWEHLMMNFSSVLIGLVH